jgi:hypothetical protein
LAISRLIGQTLANYTIENPCSPVGIIDPLGYPIAVPEVKLSQVAVYVFLRAVLINVLHAALEDRKITLNSIGVNSGVYG